MEIEHLLDEIRRRLAAASSIVSLIQAASDERSSSVISSPLRGSRPIANQTSAPPTTRPSDECPADVLLRHAIGRV